MTDPNTVIVSFFTNLAPSYLAFLGVAIFFVALGLAKSKDVLITTLVAMYVGAFITALFPYRDWIQTTFLVEHPTAVLMFLFGFLTVVTALSLRKYILSNYQHRAVWRTTEVVVLSVMVTGLLFSILHHVVLLGTLFPGWQTPEVLIASKQAFAFWLIAPVLSFPLFIRPQ